MGNGHLIRGMWNTGEGPELASHEPGTGEVVWQGRAATSGEIDRAVMAAREAFESWGDSALEMRIQILERFAEQLGAHKQEMAETISRETGKPLWESNTEVDSM